MYCELMFINILSYLEDEDVTIELWLDLPDVFGRLTIHLHVSRADAQCACIVNRERPVLCKQIYTTIGDVMS